MGNRARALAVTACLLATGAYGAWPLEPASVMGLFLGEPVAAGALPNCNLLPPGKEGPCHQGGWTDHLELQMLPELGFGYFGRVHFFDGRVMSIDLTFKQWHFDEMLEILQQRYGPATHSRVDQVTIRSGAALSSRCLTWTGARVTIVLTERDSSVDESSAIFAHHGLLRASQQERATNAKEAAKKF